MKNDMIMTTPKKTIYSAAEAMIKNIANRLLCQAVWFCVQTELDVTRQYK